MTVVLAPAASVALVLFRVTPLTGPLVDGVKLYESWQVPVLVTVKVDVWPFVFAVQVTELPFGVTETA